MYYLQKVTVLLDKQEYWEKVKAWGLLLEKQGLVFALQSCGKEDWNCTCDEKGDTGHVAGLWITDSAEAAGMLQEAGEAVLAFLHEVNHELDFSGIQYACEALWELDADFCDKVYRRYKRLPWEILETDRLLLRETVPEDAESFFRIYEDPSVTQYTEGVFPDIEQEKRYINDYIDRFYSFYNFGIWTVILKESGEVIGRAGFSYREGFEEPELGYVIGVPWQRKGYAEEICRAILAYGWEELGFTTVHAFVNPKNEGSLRLSQKLEMRRNGSAVINDEAYLCMVLERKC